MAPLRSRGSRNKGYLLFFLIVLITTPSPPARRRGSKLTASVARRSRAMSPPARRRGLKLEKLDNGGLANAALLGLYEDKMFAGEATRKRWLWLKHLFGDGAYARTKLLNA